MSMWQRIGQVAGNALCLAFLFMVLLLTVTSIHCGRRGDVPYARRLAARAQIKAFQTALGAFRMDTGRYPTDAEGLQALRTAPANAAGWRGPYLPDDIPMDPWGAPYVYHASAHAGTPPRVCSYEADGRPGGIGDDRDRSEGLERCEP